jgi:hypothetical protein
MPKPKFETFFITTGQPFSIDLPDVLEGLNAPASATFVLSDGLEPEVSLTS